jgi:hypothetical protein
VEGEPRLVWLRYIALVRRKSRWIVLDCLPDRAVRGDGRGGGGALSNVELDAFLRADTPEPRLKKRSILHTDSAKAYRKTGCLYRPAVGALQGTFEGQAPYAVHQWVHTNCTHKKKVGQPAQYAPKRTLKLWDNSSLEVKVGTQTVDGFWASLRKAVGRTSVNTGHSSNTSQQDWLHKLVRCFQWRWWYLDAERFELLGKLFQEKRAAEVPF